MHLLFRQRNTTLTAAMKRTFAISLLTLIACLPGNVLGKPAPAHTKTKMPSVVITENDPQNAAFYEQAEAAIMSGNYQLLIDEADKMIRSEPGNPEHYYARAMAKAMARDYAGSNEDLTMVIELMDKKQINGITKDDVWMSIADMTFLIGNVDGGRKAISKAAALGNAKAKSWIELHRTDHPRNAHEFFMLAGKYKNDEVPYALALLSQAIKLQPDYAEAYYERGVANSTLNPGQALSDFDKAIALKPGFTAAFSQRGLVRRLQGDAPGSLLDAAAANRLEPTSIETLQNLAMSHAMAENHAEAIKSYSKLIELEPDNAGYYVLRAMAKLKTGDRTSAIADYRYASDLGNEYALFYLYDNGLVKPRNAEELCKIGIMLVNNSRDSEAISTFSKAIDADPSCAIAYYGRAKVKYITENTEGALMDLRKAMELDAKVAEKYADNRGLKPSLVMIYLNLGRNRRSAGRMQEALGYFDKAVEQTPGYAVSFYERGLTRASAGMAQGAIEDMMKAANLGHQAAASWLKEKR